MVRPIRRKSHSPETAGSLRPPTVPPDPGRARTVTSGLREGAAPETPSRGRRPFSFWLPLIKLAFLQ